MIFKFIDKELFKLQEKLIRVGQMNAFLNKISGILEGLE